jgi:alkylated DNA nucleotide flippase Atl1
MKALLAICMIVTATFVWAGANTSPDAGASSVVKGKVLEVKDVESYTYLHLKTQDGDTWAAVSKTSVKKGATVSIENVTVMNNFESKTLKKTFPVILFGNLASATGGSKDAYFMGSAFPVFSKKSDTADIRVAKASGANARTVAEIIRQSSELKGKTVTVSGKVVKYNPEIMGKNWLHMRDGSGSAADNTNDILVTSRNQAKIGDIVTAKGIVRTDMDFGSGYAYKVLIEDATLQ